jgi:hypothetical protein
VRVSGLIDYPDCPGGFDLRPDTFQVFVGNHRIEFWSETGGFTLRSNYTKDHAEAGLTGSWSRVRVESEQTGHVIPSGIFDLDFRTDRRFNTRGKCLDATRDCFINGGAFFGVSKDRFLTYHFDSQTQRQRIPAVDYDFLYASYYKVEGDTLSLWGTEMAHRHIFVRR